MEFVLGGVAAIGAGFFTNPLDVIKTRLQLQGELQARGMYTVHYRGFIHAFYAVAKADGVLALQKGLIPALWYQLCLNGVRLGTYDFAEKRGWTTNTAGKTSTPKCIIVGALAGCAGAFTGSPFYLVRVLTRYGCTARFWKYADPFVRNKLTRDRWLIFRSLGDCILLCG
jgi:solute carrier family 25 protein 34/35